MKFVTIRDLRGHSAQVRRWLGEGDDLVLTASGRPIALLTPVSGDSVEESLASVRRARAMAAVERIQARSVAAGLDRMGPAEIDEIIRDVRKKRRR